VMDYPLSQQDNLPFNKLLLLKGQFIDAFIYINSLSQSIVCHFRTGCNTINI